ncbi:MAG: protein kinase [Planctomycetota bacterium]
MSGSDQHEGDPHEIGPAAGSSLPPDEELRSVRARLAADIAAGRTVSLSHKELVDPELQRLIAGWVDDLADPVPATPQLPQVPGYTVIGLIDSGGQSEVYLARDNELRRPVAIKVMRASGRDEDAGRARILREARALARIRHPNIVTIHGVAEANGRVVIVMEWIDGMALGRLLRLLPKAPEPGDAAAIRRELGTAAGDAGAIETTATRTFVRIMRDIAMAAEHAHAAGLLHLDIKPANVLVRRNGTPLLVDFGLAREIDIALSRTQSFAGTPVYAAPEQLRRDDDAIAATTDVYGLGITLYELLARRPPLHDQGFAATLRAVETGRLPMLSTVATVPPDLANVVHKAIAFEPHLRYQSAAALAADLQAWLDDREVSARPATLGRRLRRRLCAEPWKVLVLLLLAVTVPLVTWLGVALANELAYTKLTKEQLLHARAKACGQGDLQYFLMLADPSPHVLAGSDEFVEFFGVDKTFTAVALMTIGRDDPERACELCDGLDPDWRCLPAMVALRERLGERRPYFSVDEVAALEGTNDELELLVFVVDRVLANQDSDVETDLLELVEPAKRLLAIQSSDPLALGIQAYAAGKLGNRAECELACFALARRFADDSAVCIWRMMALGELDPALAITAGLAYIKVHPGDYPSSVMTARLMQLHGQGDTALDLVRRAVPPPHGVEHQKLAIAWHHAQSGRLDEARATLDTYRAPATGSEALFHLTVLAIACPELAEAVSCRLLEMPHPRFAELDTILGIFGGNRTPAQNDILLDACKRGIELYPGHARFRIPLACHLVTQHRFATAARIFGDLRVPKTMPDNTAWAMATAFHNTNDWKRLEAAAARWTSLGPDSPQQRFRACYYLGIALSRTGRYAAAKAAFAECMANATAAEKLAPRAAMEVLWLDVCPDTPTELRDRDQAANLLAKYRNADPKEPWLLTILAEACCHAGDRAAARAFHAKAKAQVDARLAEGQPPCPGAPDDLVDWIGKALHRYE